MASLLAFSGQHFIDAPYIGNIDHAIISNSDVINNVQTLALFAVLLAVQLNKQIHTDTQLTVFV